MAKNVIDRDKLVLAAQTGDQLALSQLLATCQTDARRYARKHCQVSDIDDAVQESLIVISNKIGGLKAVVAFSSWLFVVIKRECHRLSRTMLRFDRLDSEAWEQKLALRSDESLRLDLINALESLPAHYREVVLLRDFEELSIQEIAQRLGQHPSAIKSRLHRAREMVREYLIA